jgi:hypothetical protein
VSPTPSNTPGGRGATLPYTEYEAEAAAYDGTLIGPSATMAMNGGNLTTEMAAESSGREAVKLTAQGQSITFTTTAPCNAIVVRYIIPDAAGGGGINATLSCYVNGVFNQELNMTSVYNWDYGNTMNYTFSSGVNVAGYNKNPAAGSAFHLYDETHALLGEEVAAGSTITLEVGPSDTAAYYVIDLIDLEEVGPPLSMPSGFVPITSYGATSGGADCSADIQNCVNANTQVWIPQGAFACLSALIKIPAGTTVEGAGMWYSSLTGYYATLDLPGSGANLFSNFAIFGNTTNRDDGASDVGFNDKAGTNSILSNIWIEHEKVGYWVGNGGGTTQNLLITNCRIRDLYADGVNFSDGASNSTVTQCNFRNTGDDSVASWASSGNGDNAGNLFSFNTVQCPWRADCFALYGGGGNSIEDNVCSDTLNQCGILVSQEFTSYTMTGTNYILRNTLISAGGDYASTNYGALEFWGAQSPGIGAAATFVDSVMILNPPLTGIIFSGPYNAGGETITNTEVSGGNYGIEVLSGTPGTATISTSTVQGSGVAPLINGSASFTLTQGPGDVGL